MAKKISSSELKTFRKEALASHNKCRDIHGSPDLKLSNELSEHAQKWAEQLARTGDFKSSSHADYGENVAMHYSSASTEFSGEDATDMWYKEHKEYDYKKPGFSQKTGHFAQIVWKTSKEFGIGKAITSEGKVIVVANYKPPGNVQGRFPENVFPPLAGKEYKRAGRRGSTSSSSSSSSSSSDEEGKKKKGVFKRKSKDKWGGCPRVPRREQREFMRQALEEHNDIRRHHGAKPLEASRQLTKRARKWARYLAKNGKFEHSKYSDIGENVAMNYSSATTEYSGERAASHWYSEIHNYDFKKPGFTKGAGHFTQMVWKDSREFGIGKAITKDGKVIIVGQYRPPGNVIDHFEENVARRDDGKMPPPPREKETTRVVRTTEHESGQSRDAKATEVDETIRKMGGVKLKEADVYPSDLKTFQKTTLDAVNKIRTKHGAGKLKRSDELDRRAQVFAADMAKKNEFRNSDEKDVGENVAMHYNSASTEFTGQQVVDMWYKQVEKYDFKKPGFTSGAGHFTQMVWKGSQEFGIGKAITKEGKVLSVAFFRPPGNVMPQQHFKDNVLPAKK